MKIKKETIVWIFLIVPFFYPSSIADTSLSSIWYYWKLCAVACGVIYIFKRIKKIKCLEKSTWFIIVMYIMQIIASAINKLDILYDFKTAVMMGVFVLVVSFLSYEYGNRAILFFYRLVNVFIWLNFLSVIFLYGRGIARDSYDTAIYFWSTKNHIISLTIVYLVIIFYLYNENYIHKKGFLSGVSVATIAVFLMGSSTAITALIVLGVFMWYCTVCNKRKKPANMKAGIVIGVIADVAIVVFRVQEKLGLFIGTIFGKDTTLTGRTDLWDQALELIGIHFLYGKGDSYALNQYGWLTKTYWNDKTQILEDVYFVAHNQFLEVLVNGGIICLIPFLLFFYSMIKSARKIRNYNYKNIIAAAILGYFIAMITDLITPYEPLYLFILISSYIYMCEKRPVGRMKKDE